MLVTKVDGDQGDEITRQVGALLESLSTAGDAARDAINLADRKLDYEHLADNIIAAIIKAWNNSWSMRGSMEEAKRAVQNVLSKRSDDIQNGNSVLVAMICVGVLWDEFGFQPRS